MFDSNGRYFLNDRMISGFMFKINKGFSHEYNLIRLQ